MKNAKYKAATEQSWREMHKGLPARDGSAPCWHVICPDTDTGETACALLGRDGVLQHVADILDEAPGVVITIVPPMYGGAHLNGKPV